MNVAHFSAPLPLELQQATGETGENTFFLPRNKVKGKERVVLFVVELERLNGIWRIHSLEIFVYLNISIYGISEAVFLFSQAVGSCPMENKRIGSWNAVGSSAT